MLFCDTPTNLKFNKRATITPRPLTDHSIIIHDAKTNYRIILKTIKYKEDAKNKILRSYKTKKQEIRNKQRNKERKNKDVRINYKIKNR